MSAMIHIRGSHGEFTVNAQTGAIAARHAEPGDDGYADIVRFDAATLDVEDMDILECGFWTEGGSYVAPEPEFVAHVANLKAGGRGLL